MTARYFNDEVIEQNKVRAAELFSQAASMGDSIGMNFFGLCCVNGEGVEKDEKKGIELFNQAVEMGNCQAMCNLGWCFLHGVGVKLGHHPFHLFLHVITFSE